ncbi:hypothetical protein [Gloeothece citriformis]|nr:hypothetical protein [Gloeothece citriformis]
MIYEIEEYGLPTEKYHNHNPSLQNLELIFNKFHVIARSLKNRRDKQTPLEIKDEYDLQYLMKALLSLYFDHITEEPPIPSSAGGGSRADFWLKSEKILIETKKTRESHTDKKIADELIIDKERYQSLPDCKMLICFVYDPDERLRNPHGLEKDLSSSNFKVYIRPIP